MVQCEIALGTSARWGPVQPGGARCSPVGRRAARWGPYSDVQSLRGMGRAPPCTPGPLQVALKQPLINEQWWGVDAETGGGMKPGATHLWLMDACTPRGTTIHPTSCSDKQSAGILTPSLFIHNPRCTLKTTQLGQPKAEFHYIKPARFIIYVYALNISLKLLFFFVFFFWRFMLEKCAKKEISQGRRWSFYPSYMQFIYQGTNKFNKKFDCFVLCHILLSLSTRHLEKLYYLLVGRLTGGLISL